MKPPKNCLRELSFTDLQRILQESLQIVGEDLRWRKKGGKLAGSQMPVGYWIVSVFSGGRLVRAYRHQIVIILATGEDPRGLRVDHLNGVRGDDRPSNLRLLRHGDNVFARHCTKGPTGLIGVHFRANRWEVLVVEDRKRVFRGRFEFAEVACEAYWAYRSARDPAGASAVTELRASQMLLARELDAKRPIKRQLTLTGVPGVTMLRGKFYVQTNLHGKKVHLGTFTDLEEARKAFTEGRARLGLSKEVQWRS